MDHPQTRSFTSSQFPGESAFPKTARAKSFIPDGRSFIPDLHLSLDSVVPSIT